MPGFEEELNEIIGDVPAEPSEPPTNEPSIEPPAPATPPAGDVPPAGAEPPAAPQDGTPAEPAPVAPEPPAAPAPSEDPRDAQIRQMQETISALQQTIESVAKKATAPVEPAAPAGTQPEVLRFLEKEEDLDKALNSVDNFNAMLSSVMSKFEAALLAKSEMLAQQVAHGVYTQRSAVNEFYSTNQDLAANKAFVGVVANELAAAHPDWDMGKVIENLATEVRNRLRLSGVPLDAASAAPAPPSSPPAFAGGGPARPNSQGAKPTGIAGEIAELLDI